MYVYASPRRLTTNKKIWKNILNLELDIGTNQVDMH